MIESSQTSKFPPHRINVKKNKSKQTSQENTETEREGTKPHVLFLLKSFLIKREYFKIFTSLSIHANFRSLFSMLHVKGAKIKGR